MTVAATGIAWGASISLTSKKLGASALTTPVMFPDAIATTNAGTAGKLEANDKVTFTFSRVVNETTICSGWTGQPSPKSIAVTWSAQNNTGKTGNDVLVVSTVGGTCANGFHIGSVDLGSPGYVSTNVQLSNCNTTLTLGTSTTTVVVTLVAPAKNTTATVSSGSAAAWTPDPVVADTSGNTIGASGNNLASSTATVQF